MGGDGTADGDGCEYGKVGCEVEGEVDVSVGGVVMV